ncbi:MAG: hypothetical protein HYZ26_13080 [Chloroflexi bacterium]|nr:hypothetical protein [Chloroflexota bacterium]
MHRLLRVPLLGVAVFTLAACAPALPVVSYEEACATDGSQAMVAGYLQIRTGSFTCLAVVGTGDLVSCELVMFDDLKDPQDTLLVEIQVGEEKNAIAPLHRLGTELLSSDIVILDYAGKELDSSERVEVVGTVSSSTSIQDVTEERYVMGPDGNLVAESVIVDSVTVTECMLNIEEIYPAP